MTFPKFNLNFQKPLDFFSIHFKYDLSPRPLQIAFKMSHHTTSSTPRIPLKVKLLSENARLPIRGSALAAGFDLFSSSACIIPARGKALISTDISIRVPPGTYGRIAPRSGLAWKHSLDVGAGVIDEDYRGPLGVVMFNFSDEDFSVKQGDRIAQLILEKIYDTEIEEVDQLEETERGEGRFGSTGINNYEKKRKKSK